MMFCFAHIGKDYDFVFLQGEDKTFVPKIFFQLENY
jgi:hypothetical protein